MRLYDHDFYQNDTPGKCLDRMVGYLLQRDEISFRDEVQYFWRQKWEIAAVPDPKDADTLQYALKSCIIERMAVIWREPPKNRADSVPAWCHNVPPHITGFSVISDVNKRFFEDDTSEIFGKRNIFAPRNFMFFV